jgi:hypothetical protein
MSPVRYELGFYIPEDYILHSHCRENLRSYLYRVALRYTPRGRNAVLVYVSRHSLPSDTISPPFLSTHQLHDITEWFLPLVSVSLKARHSRRQSTPCVANRHRENNSFDKLILNTSKWPGFLYLTLKYTLEQRFGA